MLYQIVPSDCSIKAAWADRSAYCGWTIKLFGTIWTLSKTIFELICQCYARTVASNVSKSVVVALNGRLSRPPPRSCCSRYSARSSAGIVSREPCVQANWSTLRMHLVHSVHLVCLHTRCLFRKRKRKRKRERERERCCFLSAISQISPPV